MTDQISQEQLVEYAEAFDVWDLEGEGTIQVAHIDHVLKALGESIHPAVLEKIQKRKEAENETVVTFEEFLYLLQTGGTVTDYDEDALHSRSRKLQQAFSLFDPSQTGTISVVDLRKALRDVMKDSEIDELVKKADTKGTGRIDCGYLAELMTGS